MTTRPSPHPDLLQRFVATPYVFSKSNGPNWLCVESNDLEIALNVRQSGIAQFRRNRAGGLFCKLIREMTGVADSSEISILSDENLRILHMGGGTILIYDIAKSELLGFISTQMKTQELVSSIIPAVLNL
jgi:hypothetical protein